MRPTASSTEAKTYAPTTAASAGSPARMGLLHPLAAPSRIGAGLCGPAGRRPWPALELVLSCLHEPHSIDELIVLLDFSKIEVRRWCLPLMEQVRVRKLSKPVRYVRQQPPS
jgi:hypothetical protein